MINQFIDEAKRNNSHTVIWPDLAEAYSSVPHQLIRKELDHYQIPSEVVEQAMAHMDVVDEDRHRKHHH